MKVCSTPGCPNPVDSGRCVTCRSQADAHRGSAAARGYDHEHRVRFRAGVLDRDPICVRCEIRVATVADHYPRSRRQLAALGLDPNDPQHGRGLCKPCHDAETAARQPGGWHATD